MPVIGFQRRLYPRRYGFVEFMENPLHIVHCHRFVRQPDMDGPGQIIDSGCYLLTGHHRKPFRQPKGRRRNGQAQLSAAEHDETDASASRDAIHHAQNFAPGLIEDECHVIHHRVWISKQSRCAQYHWHERPFASRLPQGIGEFVPVRGQRNPEYAQFGHAPSAVPETANLLDELFGRHEDEGGLGRDSISRSVERRANCGGDAAQRPDSDAYPLVVV